MKKLFIYLFGFLACLGLAAAGGETPGNITQGDAALVWVNVGGLVVFAFPLFMVAQLSSEK